MSKDQENNINQNVETVENLRHYKIRIYTYANGVFEDEFYSKDYEEACYIANRIIDKYDDGWWWKFVS